MYFIVLVTGNAAASESCGWPRRDQILAFTGSRLPFLPRATEAGAAKRQTPRLSGHRPRHRAPLRPAPVLCWNSPPPRGTLHCRPRCQRHRHQLRRCLHLRRHCRRISPRLARRPESLADDLVQKPTHRLAVPRSPRREHPAPARQAIHRRSAPRIDCVDFPHAQTIRSSTPLCPRPFLATYLEALAPLSLAHLSGARGTAHATLHHPLPQSGQLGCRCCRCSRLDHPLLC